MLVLKTRCGDDERTVTAHLAVHGGGRVANVSELDLEAGEIAHDGEGVRVNDYLQSVSNPVVYAAGDAAASGYPPLSPVAAQEGKTVAANVLDGNHLKAAYGEVPTAVFSVPALASVGLTEQAANERGYSFRIAEGDWAKFHSMRKVGETHALYRILIERQTGKLLGAHLLGTDAAETINLFAMAMRLGATASEVKSVLMTFPTFASDLRSML